MISREEVAKKLRSKFACGLGITPGSIAYALGYTAPKESTYDNAIRELFELLADLIDPTCQYQPNVHATWFDDNGEELEDTSLEDTANSENAYCSFCGYEMMTGEEGWFDYERKEHGNLLIPNFNYCPNCGARVVRDEA